MMHLGNACSCTKADVVNPGKKSNSRRGNRRKRLDASLPLSIPGFLT